MVTDEGTQVLSYRIVPESQFDLCSICNTYAELDDLEKIICYVCQADIGNNSLNTIEHLAHNALWHPYSEIGQRITQIRHTLDEMNAAANETENNLYALRNHIENSEWTFNDQHNELYESHEQLTEEVDLLDSELLDIYRRIGDLEANLDEIHPAIQP